MAPPKSAPANAARPSPPPKRLPPAPPPVPPPPKFKLIAGGLLSVVALPKAGTTAPPVATVRFFFPSPPPLQIKPPSVEALTPETIEFDGAGIGDDDQVVFLLGTDAHCGGAMAALDAERYLSEQGIQDESEQFADDLMAELFMGEFDTEDTYNAYSEGVDLSSANARAEL